MGKNENVWMEQQLEAIARIVTKIDGMDPNDMTPAADLLGNPIDIEAWQLYLPEARQILAALGAMHGNGEIK